MPYNIKVKKLLAVANSMLGTPYEYGAYAKTKAKGKPPRQVRGKPKGVDCSSLIQYIYSQVGIDLPRSSILQATKGREINGIKNLKPGDLIFFEGTKGHYSHNLFSARGGSALGGKGKKIYIGHVALYLGGGKAVDAEENRGNAALVSLQKLMKRPFYKIILIKRVI